MPRLVFELIALLLLGVGLVVGIRVALGLVVINEHQVGLVFKRFDLSQRRSLEEGQLIALNGEAGYQADVLAPGWHFLYWPWQYKIIRSAPIVILRSEIGLVIANAGQQIPFERTLGQAVACNDYQDARQFLAAGGQKGRQLAVLPPGTYRLNPILFEVITKATAEQHGLQAQQLRQLTVPSDQVGIVTTLEGASMPTNAQLGVVVPGHDHYQKPEIFLANGGQRGVQAEVLPPGVWRLNPWFLTVGLIPKSEMAKEHVLSHNL